LFFPEYFPPRLSSSKFANGTGKRQDDSRSNATRSKWKRDCEKDPHVTGAECSRDLLETLIDTLKSNASRTDEQRKGHYRGSEDDRAPGEYNVNVEMLA